jgi:hypothetical protein
MASGSAARRAIFHGEVIAATALEVVCAFFARRFA